MYWGVAKPDPLKIQNSPKYRGVETPRVLGSGELRLPGVLCTGESFFVSFNLQAHAAAFKATLIQKTV